MNWFNMLKAKTKAQKDLQNWTNEEWGSAEQHRAKEKGKTPKSKTKGTELVSQLDSSNRLKSSRAKNAGTQVGMEYFRLDEQSQQNWGKCPQIFVELAVKLVQSNDHVQMSLQTF